MTKSELLNEMQRRNNGYLFTNEVVLAGISRTYLSKYLEQHHFQRAAHGIYYSSDSWPDELFILQKGNPRIVYSMDTALYLHGLTDREYSAIHVSVPKGFNPYRLKEKGVKIHTYSPDLYTMGVTEVSTNFNNIVRAYDRERCICDIVAERNELETQTFQTALKEYMSEKSKKLERLIQYADRLNEREEMMKYVDVML